MQKRPSKKQRELLGYIDMFVQDNGYGPSYREVMSALDYKSVSTVAVHINGLIACGLLRKKDNSARSLEVIAENNVQNPDDEHIKWLKREIKKREADESETAKNQVGVLMSALEILLDQTGKK